MERISTVSGTGPVYVDNRPIGHCAFEINVYKDATGRITGRGHVMGESGILGKIYYGQNVEISKSEEGDRFRLSTGDWSQGSRKMEVETGPDIYN